MKINRRLFLTGSTSTAALIALAACSGSGSSSSSSEPVELAGSDVNVQERSALQQGGTLRIAASLWIPNFNPLHLDGNVSDNGSVLQYFAGIKNWIYADDASFKPREEFCLDYKEEEADGKTKITMHLNPKAKWNSGTSITVADYQGTWKACNGEDEAFTAMVASTDGWVEIESIEAGVDEFEMIVTFKSTFPDWSAVLSGSIVPAALTGSPEDFASWTDGSVTDHWTGPYLVTSADATSQQITMEPNPNWWGEAPLLDSVVMKVIDTAQTGPAFANGEIDVVAGIIDASTYDQCSKRSDGQIRQAVGVEWRHFTINGSEGILADKKLRHALVKGMDRVTMTEADLQGLPVPASQLQLGNHLFNPADSRYQDNVGALAYDKDKAIAELEELGWKIPEGKEYREKDGQVLSIKYLRLPDTPTSVTEGKVLQANMKEIGVEIVMDDTNVDAFFPDRISKGLFEIVAYTWVSTAYPMNNIGQIYGKGSASNRTGLYSDRLEELIGQVATESDEKKRVELAQEADKEIWDLAGVIPIYSRANYTAVPAKLANFGAFGLSSTKYENIGYLKE